MAVLPLGTGNDLSRTLGWGPGYEGDESIGLLLAQIGIAPVVSLDRWKLGMSGGRQFVMNNYFSLGVDAKVALGFHTLREEMPELFSSRFGNKVIYAINGLKAALEKSTPLASVIELMESGIRIPLPPDIEGLIFLNLSSYAGGAADLWGASSDDEDSAIHEDEHDHGHGHASSAEGGSALGFNAFSCGPPSCTLPKTGKRKKAFRKPAIDDSLIEVAGITGSFHMGTITASLTNAIRIAQASEFSIIVKSGATDLALPFQVDGEPASLTPADQHIYIRAHSAASMLSASSLPSDMKKPNPVRIHALTDEDETDSPDHDHPHAQHDLEEHHGTPIEGEFLFW